MIKIEKQLTSLEYAKKFRELGIKQESLFVYKEVPWICKNHEDGTKEILETKIFIEQYGYFDPSGSLNIWSAFTVGELGVMLPDFTEQNSKADGILFLVNYNNEYQGGDENEANARARILIFLLEIRVISVNEVNARIQ